MSHAHTVVVDIPDPDTSDLYAEVLTNAGFRVLTKVGAPAEHPDVVVPYVRSVDLAPRLRCLSSRTIVLTSWPGDHPAPSDYAAVLSIPLLPEALVSIVSRVLATVAATPALHTPSAWNESTR